MTRSGRSHCRRTRVRTGTAIATSLTVLLTLHLPSSRAHATPTAAVMIRSCCSSLPANTPIWWPSRITSDPVAHRQHLGEVGGDQDDGDAGAGELADELMDIGLGADVDASRRLVEDQDRWLDVEPLGEHHLLLVAAGQVGDGRGE